jgi:hypothetical protein
MNEPRRKRANPATTASVVHHQSPPIGLRSERLIDLELEERAIKHSRESSEVVLKHARSQRMVGR